MRSKITGGDTTYLFHKTILQKHNVSYYKCDQTGFVQTEEPYWLDEAYASAITKLDVGLVHRNLYLADIVDKVLLKQFDAQGQFLDYAGGYGLFTRLMRDKGFLFYNTDKYCQNIFAEYFDVKDLPASPAFEAVTAFEVFEHLPDPIAGIKEMLAYSDNLLFTTELQPASGDLEGWPYLSTETGQHVSFYNEASLTYLANNLDLHFYTDGSFLHLFTKKKLTSDPLARKKDSFLLRKAKKLIKSREKKEYGNLRSLLMDDWEYVKQKLNS